MDGSDIIFLGLDLVQVVSVVAAPVLFVLAVALGVTARQR